MLARKHFYSLLNLTDSNAHQGWDVVILSLAVQGVGSPKQLESLIKLARKHFYSLLNLTDSNAHQGRDVEILSFAKQSVRIPLSLLIISFTLDALKPSGLTNAAFAPADGDIVTFSVLKLLHGVRCSLIAQVFTVFVNIFFNDHVRRVFTAAADKLALISAKVGVFIHFAYLDVAFFNGG